MALNVESTQDSSDTSANSLHFGQLVWAKLGSAPFWPGVIFSEKNQDWISHKGKCSYVNVFFFGETAERNWVRPSRVLPFLGVEELAHQRMRWRRQGKKRRRDEQRLKLKDRSNLNIAIQQTIKLSKFSLQRRIAILKTEWWHWDDIKKLNSTYRIPTGETPNSDEETDTLKQVHDTEEVLQLLNSSYNESDDIMCLPNESVTKSNLQSSIQYTTSVCFHPLTSYEEETIIREMVSSLDNSFSTCRILAEKEYLNCIQKNFPSTSIISEHWFYLFVFRHCQRLASSFPRWANDMNSLLEQSPLFSPMQQAQIKSLIILFQQYLHNGQIQSCCFQDQ